MKQPIGRCIICERFGKMWRCVDITGGGTFHGVCVECRDILNHLREHVTSLTWILTVSLVVNVLFTGLLLFVVFGIKW